MIPELEQLGVELATTWAAVEASIPQQEEFQPLEDDYDQDRQNDPNDEL